MVKIDKKGIIIIMLTLIIIALISVIAYDHIEESQMLYHRVNITDTFSLEVPVSSNVTKMQLSEHMHIVRDSQNNITITSFNMGNESVLDLIEDGSQYIYTQEAYKIGAEQVNMSNHTVWHNSKENIYIAFFSPEETNDNIIIVCRDKETMARMIGSVKY